MDFEDKGMILGIGCGTVEATAGSVFPQMAYQIAKETSLDKGIQGKEAKKCYQPYTKHRLTGQ